MGWVLRAAGLLLLAGLLTVSGDVALGAVRVHAEDGVFVRRDREGRLVYTNVANVSVDGLPLERVPLPDLVRLDLRTLPAAELPKVDQRVQASHEATQNSDHCESIRAASRVPLRTWMWSDRQRELMTAAALFVFSLIVGFAWSGRVMRTLMPIAPFAGSMFLLYVATARSQAAVDDLHAGLRACSADLPEAKPSDPDTVKVRLAQALDLQRSIETVYEARAGMMEQLSRGE